MIQLDHALLRTFIACVDAMSFSRAALTVHRSPATISTHILRLEQEIGAALFLRTTRSLALTRAGEQLETYARRILRLHDEAAAAFQKPDISGTLTIGAPDDFISQFLPPVFRRFGMLYPKVEIKVVCAQTTALMPMVQAGTVDLAVVTHSQGIGGILIRQEPLVWICARDRAALERRPLPVALFEPDSQLRHATLKALTASNIPFRAAYESFSLAGLLTIVEASLAIAAVTRLSAPPELILRGEPEGLPHLPGVDIALVRSTTGDRPLCDALEALIFEQDVPSRR